VTGAPLGSFAAGAPVDAERVAQHAALVQARATFVTADSRLVSDADLRQALTHGEPDLFRALQRLPGVSARDEYSAGLWTRGAAWDKTVVLYDGLPMFNALHGAGVLSAVNPDLLGSVTLHTGVQPPRTMSGAAGLVELDTRSGAAVRTQTSLEVSSLSARAAIERAWPRSGTALSAGVRRSHLDLLPHGLRLLGRDARSVVPFAFSDVGVRLDQRLGRTHLTISGLHTGDRLWDEIPGLVERTRATWGNVLGRASLQQPVGAGAITYTIGRSTFAAVASTGSDRPPSEIPSGYAQQECGCVRPSEGAYEAQPLNNSISYSTASLVFTSGALAATATTTAGMQIASYAARYMTEGTWPHATRPSPQESAPGQHAVASVWSDHAAQVGPVLVRSGVRWDMDAQDGRTRNHVAPHAALRADLGHRFRVTAAIARHFQHAQAIAPPGLGPNAIATTSTFWVLPSATAPVIRADVATAAGEWHRDSTIRAGVAAYVRRAQGIATADPMAGFLTGRAPIAYGESRATGVESWIAGSRGPWDGSLALTRGASTLSANGVEHPAPWERRYVGRASTSFRAGSLRGTAQASATSGARHTRYFAGSLHCSPASTCEWATPPSMGPVAELETRGGALLSLGIEWSRRMRAGLVGTYVHATNITGASGGGTYLDSRGWCEPRQRDTPSTCDPRHGRWDHHVDRMLPGIPRVVSAGVRTTF